MVLARQTQLLWCMFRTRPLEMFTFLIRFLHKYLRHFCALLGILCSFVYSLPAPAAEGHGNSPLTLRMNLEQIVAAEPWRDSLLPHGNFISATAPDTDTGHSGRGYNWKGPPAESPDWRGIKWDTAYFFGYQFAAILILYVAPESLSGWTQEDKDEFSFSKWTNHVRNPVWDGDEWWVNYILHPYWGATYYIRAQERGFKRMQSFWYAVLLSTLYEYGLEALFEPVSYQDLVVTPVAGALIGEYLFTPIRKRIRAKGQFGWSDKTVLLLTDPLGVVNAQMNRLLGVKTEISLCKLRLDNIPSIPGMPGEGEILLPSRTRIKPVWGMQLKIIW
jgi:hypothetical protein